MEDALINTTKRYAVTVILLAYILRIELGDPPSPEDARKLLDRNREDIDTLVTYLMSLEYDDAYIYTEDPGKVFYELEDHDISSKEVKAGIRRLRRAGCYFIDKNDKRDNNTISFLFSWAWMGGEDWGIARTINGQGFPKTYSQIRHEEIGDGWFYVFNSYSEYRNNPSQYEEYQPK